MPTVKDLFTYAKYLPEPEAGLDVFGRTSRYINSETNKPFHVIRAVNNVAPAILPNANSELFFEIHAAVLALDKPIAISEEEEDGFRLLTSSFVQGYNGDPDVLLNFSYSTRLIDRSSPKVAARIKGMQSLCKKLGITFTKEMAESLVYVIYTYLSVREVKIATSKAISYVIKADEAVKVDDYSDFDKLWDDEDDDFEDEDDDFDGETESNTQPDAAALAEAAKKAEAEAAKAAKEAQAQGSGKKPNVKA